MLPYFPFDSTIFNPIPRHPFPPYPSPSFSSLGSIIFPTIYNFDRLPSIFCAIRCAILGGCVELRLWCSHHHLCWPELVLPPIRLCRRCWP
ncbi:hypothetical protein D8674_017120 [Pyrus ussuriensis x Pyrus communis]|uniref:Uncharacterized protein n=1 Tax=Pyrus ussuriensis x Pyrus communis TaxID=2448454 RepID=A0A5N5HIY8_9ROSA|nr:hypothetical protein D8674_017120 [Pyrus ussuriensis x Pyrus communis]